MCGLMHSFNPQSFIEDWGFYFGMPGMTLCTLVQADQMWCLIGDSKVQVLYGP